MLENLNLFAFNKSRGCYSDWGLKWCQALSRFAPPTPAVAFSIVSTLDRVSFFALPVLVRKINNKKRFFGKISIARKMLFPSRFGAMSTRCLARLQTAQFYAAGSAFI